MLRLRLLFLLSIAASALSAGCFLDSGPYAVEGSGGTGGSSGPGGSTTSQGGSGGSTSTTTGGSSAGGSSVGGSTTTSTGTGGKPCSDPSECVDDLPCTKDRCEGGFCANPPEDDNYPAPGLDGSQTDCKKEVCDGQGATKFIPDNTQTPPNDQDPCTVDECSNGTVQTNTKPNDTPCGTGGECDQSACQGGVCVPDLAGDGTPCGAVTGCSAYQCMSGVCIFDEKPDGTVITSGVNGCLDAVCQGGVLINQPNVINCASSDGNEYNCTAPTCNANGSCTGPGVPAPDGYPCKVGGGGDGHCVSGTCTAN